MAEGHGTMPPAMPMASRLRIPGPRSGLPLLGIDGMSVIVAVEMKAGPVPCQQKKTGDENQDPRG